MFKKLIKLFTTTKVSDIELKNKDLVDKIYDIINIENLEDVLFSPVNKIFILNVYNNNFDDFLSNILSKYSERSLISVNIFSYFTDKENIQYKLKRCIPILEQNNIDLRIAYEFNEILDTITYLLTLEK
jgi:hypothetical protein